MKKTISMFVLVAVMLVSVLQCTAADTVYYPDADGNYSVSYEDDKIVDGEAYGFIVVEGLDNEVLNLSDGNLDKILYIDDTKASDGSVSFNNIILKGKLPSEEGFTGGTAFIGGEGFNSATTVGTLQKTLVPVSGITLDITTANVLVGQTITLAATVTPDNASNKTVKWTSSDPSVASVDANGVVKAEKASTTPVTITATAGEKVATCIITVSSSSIGERLAGDADGDGRVSISDAVRICQYLAGYNVTINEDNSDVDADGTVRVGDAVRICQYLAGYNVTLN